MIFLRRLFESFPCLVPCLLTGLVLGASPGVAAVPPEVQLTPTQGNPLEVTFVATDQSAGLTHTWLFGDGASATGAVVSHTYAAPGNFLVVLEIDDGVAVTPVPFWQVVGQQVEVLDFENGLPSSWMVMNMTDSPDGAIAGAKGSFHSIVNPNPGPSCAMPLEVPPNEVPRDHVPRRWLLSALVDLTAAPVENGASFDVLRILGAATTPPIFGVRLEVAGEKWSVQGYAAESSGGLSESETSPENVGSEIVLLELEARQASATLPSSGSLRLRAVKWPTGEELVDETLSGLVNGSFEMDSFDFGLLDADFPLGFDPGSLKLDDFRVVTDSCLDPSPEDLAGAWDFEDPWQTGFDSSGQGRHGSAMGGATTVLGRPRADGSLETALQLDGTGYLQIPNLGLDLVGESEVSVEAWVKVSSHPQTNLLRARQPLALRSSALAVSNYTTGSGWVSVYTTTAPPVDQWYHLAAVFDHGVASVYVDGQLAARQTLAFTSIDGTSYTDWALGARVPGAGVAADQFFTGLVDDVRIYTRALEASEIRASAGICD